MASIRVTDQPVLRFEGMTKSFGHATVLRDVSFDVHRGEIHALLGANGAGKSTLIKILAGVYQQDAGTIAVRGTPLDRHHTPSDVQDAGVSFVHQDLGLIEELSVADNIALQLGFRKRWGFVSARATERRVDQVLRDVGASFSAERLVSSLSRDEQVICAVARALALEPKLVVLDEVSASLPAPEVERLAASLRSMRRSGVAFIYVTHRLDELAGLVDRVTVLRDGQRVVTSSMGDLSHPELVAHIVGRELGAPIGASVRSAASDDGREPQVAVRELTTAELTDPVSFRVQAGEVLGICGLVGSGTRALARAMGGGTFATGGEVVLKGEALPLGRPDKMARRGCAVVPGDRQREGMISGLGLRENLLPTRRNFGGWTRAGFRLPGRETRGILEVSERFDVVPRDLPDRDVSELSGGNQQKLVFARALADVPALVVLEDPTAGVDIGSRAILYAHLQEAARAGASVVLISTDFEEVAAQAHRVLVMSNGRIATEFHTGEFTAGGLAEASYGNVPAAR